MEVMHLMYLCQHKKIFNDFVCVTFALTRAGPLETDPLRTEDPNSWVRDTVGDGSCCDSSSLSHGITSFSENTFLVEESLFVKAPSTNALGCDSQLRQKRGPF